MAGAEILSVKGLYALNSRGHPTIKVVVATRSGAKGYGLAPSGASRGEREAVELRDGGRKWLGRGVSRVLAILENEVAPRLVGVDVTRQRYVDGLLISIDGTPNKSRIGGNLTTATSIAVARAASSHLGLEPFQYIGGVERRLLPTPLLNIINGGVHAGNKLSIQEFMIIPVGADSFLDAMRISVEVYGTLKEILKEKYGKQAINVGDEGGFAPPLEYTRDALDLLVEAITGAGYAPGADVALGIDAAASQFYDQNSQSYSIDGKQLTAPELLEYYSALADEYPLVYIEDPFWENDWESFREITRKLGSRLLIVGDDLYTTNVRYLRKGLDLHATNAVLVKINQVGTLSETIDFVHEAKWNGLRAIVSHRSGDTEDPFIADLSVALGTGLIKTGAPARGERTAKYNRLIEIESMIDSPAYAGARPFPSKPKG
ncbi:MAG: phosphopyruvate hydratase [Desulfurococcales archaeon]|nr:phosphopyruvate hydratase [Desulfurococcales archaeon]